MVQHPEKHHHPPQPGHCPGSLGRPAQLLEAADGGHGYRRHLLPCLSEQRGKDPGLRQFKPGEKVRLRIINAAASSQFWLTFGGEDPPLVAADGLDVVPVRRNKTFIAIAETVRFHRHHSSQRESGDPGHGAGRLRAFVHLPGQGEIVAAPVVPRPNQYAMMKQMAAMNMRMGAPAMKLNPSEEEPQEMMENWGMQMDKGGGMKMDHAGMGHNMKGMKHKEGKEIPMDTGENKDMNHKQMDHSKMDHGQPTGMGRNHEGGLAPVR